MTTQSFIDRVKFERENHEHEPWQLRESRRGWYCAACGSDVSNVEAQKLGKPLPDDTTDQAQNA